MEKRWQLAPTCPTGTDVEFGVTSTVQAQLLWNRGLRDRASVQQFLHVDWEQHLHDPSLFRAMSGALGRVFRALKEGEPIIVHGDYDADGVTGSTLLITTLREIERLLVPERGAASSCIDFYIPHREKEGYGLHAATVGKLKERGTRLIITVDCGIACVDEIALAKQGAMDTIVVDHHQFGETLPDGFLIHPGLPEETYPFKQLAAVGVAFKFACALVDEARRQCLAIPVGWEKWLLDLVAIATVTDMVPLTGENRLLETYGLQVLNKTRRVGLLALIESAGLSLGTLDTESIGFGIGPRINAAGRMDHASLALRLLLAESTDEAKALASELDACNRERQEVTKKMMAEAEKNFQISSAKTIMLWDAAWSPSLVGLVAGRFAERFSRPVAVIGHHEGKWIGSGRSIPGFDITAAMRVAGEGILTRIGGHPQACGFALEDASQLPRLAERLQAYAQERVTEEDLIPSLSVDVALPLEQVREETYALIQTLEPFGEGNRRPVFLSTHVMVTTADTMGSTGSHLRLALVDGSGRRIKAVGFKLGSRAAEISVGSRMDLVYHLAQNEWNGRRSIECHLIDFKPCTA